MSNHAAPPVRYPVVRSRWLAAALAAYSLAGAVVLLAWALLGAGSHTGWIATSGLLWLLCSLLAAWFWRSAPCGTLVWSGTDWTLESIQDLPLCAPCPRLHIHLDLQRRLWLRLQPESAQTGPALWLWLERSSQPCLWDDLRRAVYSPVRSGRANASNASNITPHSDPQA